MDTLAITVPRRGRRGAGEACQDAAAIFHHVNGVVLTVADGVGTAPRSEIGAQLATRVIGAHLAHADLTPSTDVLQALSMGRDEWKRGLAVRAAPASAEKITFAFAIAQPPLIAIGAVGDCFGFVTRADDPGQSHLVLDQGRRPGAFANEVSVTLGDPGWHAMARFYVILDPTVNGVAVSSDGLDDVAIREDRVDGKQVRQVEVVSSFTDWLLDKARRRESAGAVEDELESWDELMLTTDDDLGIALAVW